MLFADGFWQLAFSYLLLAFDDEILVLQIYFQGLARAGSD